MNASRKRRRAAVRAGKCPKCLERPVEHVVPLEVGFEAAACSECWPELLADLRALGAHVSGCVGPCCRS